MRTFGFLLGIGILVAGATAQECPVGACDPVFVQRTCATALPADLKVAVRQPDGTVCNCPCTALATTTAQQLDSMRKERRAMNLNNARTYLRELKAPPPKGKIAVIRPMGPRYRSYYSLYLPSDSIAIEVDGTLGLCIEYERLGEAIRVIDNMDLNVPFDVGLTVFEEEEENGSTPLFPQVVETGFLDPVPRATVFVPDVFARHPDVGIELMIFMILHELGHVYRATSSECIADEFAANEAMRILFPGPELHAVLDSSMAQLRRYTLALFPCAGCTDDPGPHQAYVDVGGVPTCSLGGSYPAFECRSNAVRYTNLCEPFDVADGTCTFGYDERCWISTRTAPAYVDPELAECLPPIVVGPEIDPSIRHLIEGLAGWSLLKEGPVEPWWCIQYPQLCDERIRLKLERQVRLKDYDPRLEEKVYRSLSKAGRQFDRMLGTVTVE